jgi:uncharacterized protein YggU (UPF0235/DUF167 family)
MRPPIRITVRVHPRASRPRRRWDGTCLELWISQPPVDGAANAAVVDEVARWLGLRRHRVHLVSGHTARTKVIEVAATAVVPPPDAPLEAIDL